MKKNIAFIQLILFFIYQSAETQRIVPIPTTNLKKDPETREMLLNVFKDYEKFKKFNRFEVNVRPYISGDYAKKLDINPITQFALYKCMHDTCLFACNSENDWKIHMEQHHNLIDALTDFNLLNKDNRQQLLKFRECSYCGSEPHTGHQVCRHMEMEHRRNIFQCAHCYYRAIEIDHIIWHMEECHADSDREILLCGLQHEFQQEDEDALQNGCQQYITKIKCNLGNQFVNFLHFYFIHVYILFHAIPF